MYTLVFIVGEHLLRFLMKRIVNPQRAFPPGRFPRVSRVRRAPLSRALTASRAQRARKIFLLLPPSIRGTEFHPRRSSQKIRTKTVGWRIRIATIGLYYTFVQYQLKISRIKLLMGVINECAEPLKQDVLINTFCYCVNNSTLYTYLRMVIDYVRWRKEINTIFDYAYLCVLNFHSITHKYIINRWSV